jgi:hypothetical protein
MNTAFYKYILSLEKISGKSLAIVIATSAEDINQLSEYSYSSVP